MAEKIELCEKHKIPLEPDPRDGVMLCPQCELDYYTKPAQHSLIKNFAEDAKIRGKAIAIGITGKVNGKEFVMIEYDEVSNHDALCRGLALQEKFKLHKFAMFKTKNGIHLRFFWDNQFTHEEVNEIIRASQTNEEYEKIACDHVCINRVAGKHEEQDIQFIGVFGKERPILKTQRQIGDSLFDLCQALSKIQLKKGLLLDA